MVTITDPLEISRKRDWIAECKTREEIQQWRIAIRNNGGERFEGEAALVAEVEARIAR